MDWLLLLAYAAPVAYAAIGETVAQRSGVLNIGLEGTMLTAAFTALIVTQTTQSPWLGWCAGGLAGLLTTAIFAWFTVQLASDQVVVGTAVNLFALGLTSTLYRESFGQSGKLVTVPRLPHLLGLDGAVLLLLVIVPGVAWLLSKTSWGLAVRSAGEYPKAAEAAGFSVLKLRFGALLLAGLLGGLGGAYLCVGIAGSFAENMTGGRGFIAIALVTFGRWRPMAVFASALLIGAAESLQFRFQTLGWNVPFQLMIAMPYLLALLVLVIVGKGTVAPNALGQAFRRDR